MNFTDNLMTFSIELAQQLVNSTSDFPVNFNLSWEWVGYSKKGNAKQSLLNTGFIENVDFLIEKKSTTTGSSGGKTNENIYLTVECFQKWSVMAKPRNLSKTLGHIYVLEDKANKAVKIGFSTEVNKRVKNHKSNPFLKEIGRYPVQNIKTEINLHKILLPYRVSGTMEWYWFSDILISIVESVLKDDSC